MRRGWRVVAVVAALAVAHGSAPAQAAARSVAEPAERVAVDATELGTLSAAALDEIAEGATTAVRDQGLSPGQVKVTLVVIDHLEAIRGVRVAIVTPTHVLTSDDGDPRGPIVAQCTACAEDELMTLSTEGVLTALQRFEDLRAPPRAEPPPPLEPAPASTAEAATVDAPGSPRPLRWAGVVMLSVGGAGLVTGAVLVGLGRRPPAIETAQDLLRDFRTPGLWVLGVGGALAITGAVLVGVSGARARGRGGKLAAFPAPGGVVVGGRF
jgi:hypothetical protein